MMLTTCISLVVVLGACGRFAACGSGNYVCFYSANNIGPFLQT